MDPQTKAISSIPGAGAPNALDPELTLLNELHRKIVGLESPNSVPPPPVPVNPKRSAQINKLREAGNTHFRAGKHADAIRHYTLGIEMAISRPQWEPAGLVREELSGLYSNRAQAHMGMQAWPEGAMDAQCSVELKKVQNGKAWWRRGKCLAEMGRFEEAKEWVDEALDFEVGEQELVALSNEIKTALERKHKR